MLFCITSRKNNKFKDKNFINWLESGGYFYIRDKNNNPLSESKLTICLYKKYLEHKNI